jgi:hypothetical protein
MPDGCRCSRRRLQGRRQGRLQSSPAVPQRRDVLVGDNDSRGRLHRTRCLDRHLTPIISVPLAVPTMPGREVVPGLATDPGQHLPDRHPTASQRSYTGPHPLTTIRTVAPQLRAIPGPLGRLLFPGHLLSLSCHQRRPLHPTSCTAHPKAPKAPCQSMLNPTNSKRRHASKGLCPHRTRLRTQHNRDPCLHLPPLAYTSTRPFAHPVAGISCLPAHLGEDAPETRHVR